MKLRSNIVFGAIGLMILSGCSSTRYVPDGEFWLKRTRVKFDDKKHHLSRSDFVNLQRQQSNDRLLGYPLKLKMYSSVNIEKKNWWSQLMQRAGQPPVVFDSIYAGQTVQQMNQYLINNGFFNATVYYVCDTLRRKKTIQTVYHINPGNGYHYRNVSFEVKDDSLVNQFTNWQLRTSIKSGQPYDIEVLETERLRITRRLQNQGYYFFNKDQIEYYIDSALNANLMDVHMVINPPKTSAHSEKYRYDNVYIFPDENHRSSAEKTFDTTCYTIRKSRTDTTLRNYYFIHSQPLQIKPYIITSKLLMRSGELYNTTNIDQTYENLLDLRVYRTTSISVQPQQTDTNAPKYLLNTIVEVQQELPHTWRTEIETTTTAGLQGAGFNAMYQNRNLFGGAEIFSLRLRGLMEVQYLFNKQQRIKEELDIINNFDVKIDAVIDFPRFIAPFFNLRRTAQYRPRTLLNVGYSRQFKPQYKRSIVNTSFAYFWRTARVTHTLFPIDLNWVNIDMNVDFKNSINEISQSNKRLDYQYSDHFIFAARYGFLYTEQQNRPVSFNAFRFSIESSGNLLSLISKMSDEKKPDNQPYKLLGLAYSQYIRSEAEMKRYWYLNSKHLLVTRLMIGGGYAYGNSTVLPYEKGFFAGGNNNIRAWPMNKLGPGSYYDPDKPNIERVGDIVAVGNIEYRFPIYGALNGALFVDAGNIWLLNDNELFPNGEFEWKDVPNDLAVGGGVGVRWDLGFFVIRLDGAIPLRNPAYSSHPQWKDFVLNFGIGYPF